RERLASDVHDLDTRPFARSILDFARAGVRFPLHDDHDVALERPLEEGARRLPPPRVRGDQDDAAPPLPGRPKVVLALDDATNLGRARAPHRESLGEAAREMRERAKDIHDLGLVRPLPKYPAEVLSYPSARVGHREREREGPRGRTVANERAG